MACQNDIIYQEEQSLTDGVWTYAQPLKWSFDIKDTTQIYRMILDIDHADTYDYQNIYTIIETTYPDETTNLDTLSLELTNKQGLWNGKCRSERCKIPILLRDQFKFQSPGNYSLTFHQHTRIEELAGINTFKLVIEKYWD